MTAMQKETYLDLANLVDRVVATRLMLDSHLAGWVKIRF